MQKSYLIDFWENIRRYDNQDECKMVGYFLSDHLVSSSIIVELKIMIQEYHHNHHEYLHDYYHRF